jgi:hypothetical protein
VQANGHIRALCSAGPRSGIHTMLCWITGRFPLVPRYPNALCSEAGESGRRERERERAQVHGTGGRQVACWRGRGKESATGEWPMTASGQPNHTMVH